MCDLCSKISTLTRVSKGPFKGWSCPETNENQIVYDPTDNTYNIWSDGDGDPFQAGLCIQDIKYCPRCARELKGE